MPNWIINESGLTEEVIKAVKASSHATFTKGVQDQIDRANARKTLLEKTDENRGKFRLLDEEIGEYTATLAKMDADDKAMFECAKAAALAALAMVPTSHCGVTARANPNGKDAPRGQTLTISVSGYAE